MSNQQMCTCMVEVKGSWSAACQPRQHACLDCLHPCLPGSVPLLLVSGILSWPGWLGLWCELVLLLPLVQGVALFPALLPMLTQGLAADTEPLRKAAAKAVVAVIRQAASPSQQADLCQDLLQSHPAHSVAKLNFLEAAGHMISGCSAR